MIHHDNAPAHSVFFGCINTVAAPQPPYSSDLAPSDFFLFPKMKFKLRGRCFDTVEEIQPESQMVLDALKEWDFLGVFQAWQDQ